MEYLFRTGEPEQGDQILRRMLRSLRLTYICVWSYMDHPFNFLQGINGVYEEEGSSSRASSSSSSGSRARELFNVYRQMRDICVIQIGERVPGHAFRTRNPYLEVKMPDLYGRVYTSEQLRFYQEARIKTAVFIGCNLGEIEMGMSTDPPIDLRQMVESLFPPPAIHPPIDPNHQQQPPSSSSSSLLSLSVDDSVEFPTLLYNALPTSFMQNPQIGETQLENALRASPLPAPATAPVRIPYHQSISSQMRDVCQWRSIESEDDTMMKAILAVLSSSSSPPRGQRPPAFRRYRGQRPPPPTAAMWRPSLFKRAIVYLRSLATHQAAGNPRQMTAQSLQHSMQERKRRRKINDSLNVLKSLLPPGSKKDKASVLQSTIECVSELRSQVSELLKKNQILESQLNSAAVPTTLEESSSGERVRVETAQVSSSSNSEARLLEMRITVRGEDSSMLDLVIRLLEFLKQQRNLSLMSIESNTAMSQQNIPLHGIILVFKIHEEDEFDEAGFQEAVRRVCM
ncbi:putative transcription factor bHLH041 [Andrographis paniculata]|uniref:putative transcription factor bHLH041 n=1 Tax=Andrographis paniculata TaxID=175694 RepID=UPI0021E865A1|nr:putative transcription factor bHLH041 [Andrographis paniculata]